jgi:cytosine/adenosine deaminase-related metal-dependent hydrolase
MVCEEDEIRDAVKRTFRMDSDPTSTHTWSAASRMYTCRWAVPHGTLTMTVHDATDPRTGRRFFDRLRGRLDGARPLGGMDNLGFPAVSTRAGDVVFLKDGKTLHVDATRLPDASLPRSFSRPEVAYSVAAAVIACWKE